MPATQRCGHGAGSTREKWCNGAAEDKTLIADGYVGDPKGSQYIETNLKEADRRIAMDIVNSFGSR